MRRFRTFIITKQLLFRAAAAVAAAAALGVSAAVIFGGDDTDNAAVIETEEAAAVFSSSDGNAADEDESYKDIISDTIPTGDSPSLTERIKAVLGLSEPDSIINSASSAVETAAETAETPAQTEKTETETTPEPKDDTVHTAAELPSHEQMISSVGLEINNATNYNVDPDTLCAADSATKLTLDAPEVLIVHTHTTECYDGDAMTGESERTTNQDYNMCAVGDVIAERLGEYGIQVIHDKTIHDYPTYQSAYTRTLETINKNMEQYPSIKVVLDVHRDAYIYNDGSKLRVAAEINGEETAQVMLVVGTDSMGLYHPHWTDNLTLASKIQNAAEIMYPGLMRPINLRRERFNMHVTRGSLLLEVGSNGNSLTEAKRAGAYIADAVAAALLNG